MDKEIKDQSNFINILFWVLLVIVSILVIIPVLIWFMT